jgi:hypothetical protein
LKSTECLPRLTHNHARECGCSFCRIKRVWPDRAAVLAVTRPCAELHEKDCVCVLCEVERSVNEIREVWEVAT